MTNRRELLKTGAALGAVTASAGLTAASARSVFGANERVVVGLMGVNGRGTDLAKAFAQSGAADIAYICDVDERAIGKCSDAISKFQMKTPQGVRDFRKVLDDPAVDALVIAAPDHWHAPATIMACAAGKHVYCEKPACHNPREGEWAIEAARKHNRVVQIGTQRRSQPSVIEAIRRLQAGEIGRVLFARGWYNNSRPTIGKGQPAAVPSWLDYSLWQGPAPERPFRDNLIHYNWHWFWNWGTGECGNNGIHSLDVCRWGLGVDYPIRVSSGGGKYRYPDDDQETPDTQTVTYDFGEKSITWEGRSWSKRGFEDSGFGIEFYGEKGSMALDGGNYRIYDSNNKELAAVKGPLNDGPHQKNFLECVKSGGRPNAPVEEGVKSTLLCHLGNIAWRTSSTLQCDPKNGHIKDNREAQALWGREYRKGWEPKV
jgi:predicted dehydrogenase